MHIALALDSVRAEVDTVAAAIRSLSVDGADLTERRHGDGLPPYCTGITLAPWPNRVADARWDLDGGVQQLDITEPDRGGALHGLLQFTDYAVLEQTADAVTLGAFIAPQHGWPFSLDTTVRFALEPDGLVVTHGVTNRSAARAPWAVGGHPFLRVGETPVEQLVLTAPAATFFEVDERLNPIRERAVESGNDLRTGRAVGELRLDTAYGSIEHARASGGRGDSAWLEAPDGARTTLWQGLDWGYLQVFTTPTYPRPEGLGVAIAVEAMTAPPDALNSGTGLVWLEPGASWQGSWGLRRSAPVD